MSNAPKRNSVASEASGVVSSHVETGNKWKGLSNYFFGRSGKSRRSFHGYLSLFTRKLLPPLGFYREVDKYCKLKAKYAADPDKIEALDAMWKDYQKYQIRKRFHWPPRLYMGKFFWSTGYYADYQKATGAAKQKKQDGDDDSSDEENGPRIGTFLVATHDQEDIDVKEFQRYLEARKNRKGKKKSDEIYKLDVGEQLEPKTTVSRIFSEDQSPNTAEITENPEVEAK